MKKFYSNSPGVNKGVRKPKLKVKKIRNFSFREREYDIVWCQKPIKGAYGQCDDPKWEGKRILKISPETLRDSKLLLEILIHEITHAHFYDLDEQAVTEFGQTLSDFLNQVGFHCDLKEQKVKQKV